MTSAIVPFNFRVAWCAVTTKSSTLEPAQVMATPFLTTHNGATATAAQMR